LQVNRADFLELSQDILGHGGVLRFQASGDSMRPFIEWGDSLIIEPVNGSQLHIGDVLFYRWPDGCAVAHRLIKIHVVRSKTVLVTKGDSLDYFDPPIVREQVLGRVIAVARGSRYLRLNSRLNKVMSRFWARLSPASWWLRPVLRPGWRLCRRFFLTARL
jgi:signal peptidase I